MIADGEILVVDDSLENRELLAAQLTQAGYSVARAASGEAALRLFQERPPDVVLLDVVMPGMDGFTTCEQLRALPGGADAAVVFVTALADIGSHQRAMESGADDFLTKPINRTEMLLRVRSLLWIKRLKVELRQGHGMIRSQQEALESAQELRQTELLRLAAELAGPLSSIGTRADALISALEGDAKKEAREIAAAGARAERTLRDLLDLQRGGEGVLTVETRPINLAALLRELLARRAAQTGRAIDLQLDTRGELEADAELLARAIDAMLDAAELRAPEAGAVKARLHERAEKLELWLEDRGPALTGEQRETLFERRPSPDAPAGASIGLALARLTAELHGGSLTQDEQDGATGLRLLLPRTRSNFLVI